MSCECRRSLFQPANNGAFRGFLDVHLPVLSVATRGEGGYNVRFIYIMGIISGDAIDHFDDAAHQQQVVSGIFV